MKVKAIQAFYDDNGIHLVGDMVTVSERSFDPDRMEPYNEVKKDVKQSKAGTKDKRQCF